MAPEITDNPGAGRYEIRVDGEFAGFAAYQRNQGEIAFTHTEIEDRFEGKGLGTQLIAQALDDAVSKQLEVLPYCSFVSAYIGEHPQLAELVPADRRQSFGL